MGAIFLRIFDRFLTGDVDKYEYEPKLLSRELSKARIMSYIFLVLSYASVIGLIIVASIAHYNPQLHWFKTTPTILGPKAFEMFWFGVSQVLQIIFLHIFNVNLKMLEKPHQRRHLTYPSLYLFATVVPILLIYVDAKTAVANTSLILANNMLLGMLYLLQHQSLHLKQHPKA